jgi:hypothetical protein
MPADALIAPLSAALLAGMSFLTVIRAKSCVRDRLDLACSLHPQLLLQTICSSGRVGGQASARADRALATI